MIAHLIARLDDDATEVAEEAKVVLMSLGRAVVALRQTRPGGPVLHPCGP